MKEYSSHYALLRPDLTDAQHSVLVVGAHNDDEKMLNIEAQLAQNGVRVTRLTLTDGSGRNLPDYPKEVLPIVRWQEGQHSAKINGVAEIARLNSPDGQLQENIEAALEFGEQFMSEKIAVFAPHPTDPHDDHRAAYEIARKLAGSETTLYTSDTISGYSKEGELLTPDFYIPLGTRMARREKKSYRAHRSQTQNIAKSQRPEMFSVLGMTKRRGQEIGLPHAAVLFHAGNTAQNPIEQLVRVNAA